MAGVTIAEFKRYVVRVLTGLAAVVAAFALVLTMLWRDRPGFDEVIIPLAPPAPPVNDGVRVTWFGVTTLLFDDGQTQLLIDGFISRPTLFEVLTGKPVDSDIATINYFMNEHRLRRLAAIIPVHSHYDHAMDIGAIANRSSASILGTETTAFIARGAGVPEDQIAVVSDGDEYEFGEFRVHFIESNHAPIGWRGSIPLAGTLEKPLVTPAAITAWPEGGSWSIVISHPSGSTLVQGSAGMRDDVLADTQIDAVFLSVGLLQGLGREYMERYWQHTVTATGARLVIPVHFDDYTRPFGEIRLLPTLLDDFSETAELFDEFRRTWDSDTQLLMPVFGEPIQILPTPQTEISG